MNYAMLIDAENIPAKYFDFIMPELEGLGNATYRRVYGNWASASLSVWKPISLMNAITPVQQYHYTGAKNAADSALIIDAMDILYAGHVEGFCLVTSDSDFTRLALRLRESGMRVIGMGERKTPRAFVVACEKFVYLDDLYIADRQQKKQERRDMETARLALRAQQLAAQQTAAETGADGGAESDDEDERIAREASIAAGGPVCVEEADDIGGELPFVPPEDEPAQQSEAEPEDEPEDEPENEPVYEPEDEPEDEPEAEPAYEPADEPEAEPEPEPEAPAPADEGPKEIPASLVELLCAIIRENVNEYGYMYTGRLGARLYREQPAFNPEDYGYARLSDLLAAIDQLELARGADGRGGSRAIYVKVKGA